MQGGDVEGCNGKEGSALQLGECTHGKRNQQFLVSELKHNTVLLEFENDLCVAVPPRRRDPMDRNSIVADPLFVDPENGNFDLAPGSPAFDLGFQPIPEIKAPVAACGLDAGGAPSCLESFLVDGKTVQELVVPML